MPFRLFCVCKGSDTVLFNEEHRAASYLTAIARESTRRPLAVISFFPPLSSADKPHQPTASPTPRVPPPAVSPVRPCRGCRTGQCPVASAEASLSQSHAQPEGRSQSVSCKQPRR